MQNFKISMTHTCWFVTTTTKRKDLEQWDGRFKKLHTIKADA